MLKHVLVQAFRLRVRPALDTVEAGLDRTKARVYSICSKYGIPCPITGHPSGAQEQQQQSAAKPA